MTERFYFFYQIFDFELGSLVSSHSQINPRLSREDDTIPLVAASEAATHSTVSTSEINPLLYSREDDAIPLVAASVAAKLMDAAFQLKGDFHYLGWEMQEYNMFNAKRPTATSRIIEALAFQTDAQGCAVWTLSFANGVTTRFYSIGLIKMLTSRAMQHLSSAPDSGEVMPPVQKIETVQNPISAGPKNVKTASTAMQLLRRPQFKTRRVASPQVQNPIDIHSAESRGAV